MKEHREKLLKLIKMMEAVRKENHTKNKERFGDTMSYHEAEFYIQFETLISIRELTKMFINELESEYMQCSEGDEIIIFFNNMIEWLQFAYDFTINNNAGISSVKSLKICGQSLNDYKRVYEKAKLMYKSPSEVYYTLKGFEFGKKITTCFTNDGVNIENGKLSIIHDDSPIISPEYIKKIDEMYEWIKTQKENQFTEDKLIKAMGKYFDKESRRFEK